MRQLTVYYDAECGFCCRVRAWLVSEPSYVLMRFVPRQSTEATSRPGLIHADKPDEMVVLDSDGGVYRGTSAYLMCIWALKRWRPWAARLASPAMRPLVRQACQMLARHRLGVSDWFGLEPDAEVIDRLSRERVVGCETGPARALALDLSADQT
ncbi:MAG: DUF393 domain-containing protein [Phycisphaera sp.]|nr:DUF393 domain-containing protein [Phycisphaera sp.]